MFALCYQLLAAFAWVALVALSVFILPFKPKIRSIFFKRFLFINRPFKSGGIWLHCASFGEVRSIKTIVELLPKNIQINISVGTKTGLEEAQKLYPFADIKYLPFEIFLPFWVTKQKALIVFEAELWFNLFYFAKKQNITTALFNARISDKSFNSYKKFNLYYKQIFNNIDFVFSQSNEDKNRLENFGAKAEVLGNIKSLIEPKIDRIFTKPSDLITCIASSHETEEILIIKSWIHSNIGGKLLIVPRHPERFLPLFNELKNLDFSVSLFSKSGNFDSQITLIDLMGKLNEIYYISDIIVLGGSFIDRGGHNPLEPAFFGCKIITGKNISNQKSLFDMIENVQIVDENSLSDAIKNAPNMPKPTIKNPLTKMDLKKAIYRVLQN